MTPAWLQAIAGGALAFGLVAGLAALASWVWDTIRIDRAARRSTEVRCRHLDWVQVLSGGVTVAYLCRACDTQLEPDWPPPVRWQAPTVAELRASDTAPYVSGGGYRPRWMYESGGCVECGRADCDGRCGLW